jgi:transposase
LKSAYSKAVLDPDRYEPIANRTYEALAEHYGCGILPARPRKPQDKAKVEAAVLLVERSILARLRHWRFHSLAELNSAIGQLLGELNDRPFQKLEGSRRSWFDMLDRPALRPLRRSGRVDCPAPAALARRQRTSVR